MAAPVAVKVPKPLDARLVTKTSLSEPKKAIALFLIFWYAGGRPSSYEYGKEDFPANSGGLLDDETIRIVENFARAYKVDTAEQGGRQLLEKNPLLISQMEPLNSSFELVWHLGSFEFTNEALNRSSERKSGRRFRKRIHYSSNIDILDIALDDYMQELAGVLVGWLSSKKLAYDSGVEDRLVRMLTVLAETSFYKTSKGDSGRIFATSGVYDAILQGNDAVEVVDPHEEAQGTTRILRSAIKAGLNAKLTDGPAGVVLRSTVDRDELADYSDRAKQAIALSNIALNDSSASEIDAVLEEETSASTESEAAPAITQPHNLIYFGAPGTGKSYQLNKLASECFPKANIRRVTFHPDYTYSQFVGCFRPYSEPVEQRVASLLMGTDSKISVEYDGYSKKASRIEYKFVPGPFMETYAVAALHRDQNFLLIIEEINRANTAAVFGDVFQLLDRDRSGGSEYDVAASDDVRAWLKERDVPFPGTLSLPPNLYIWATMNSADQGVFPMDTAFKRRWQFRYMGINAGEEELDGLEVKLGEEGRVALWNDVRKGINKTLLTAGLNEDKLLGPFFIRPEDVEDGDRFPEVFKDKVLLYLFEDACRTKRTKVFADNLATYSQLCDAFDKDGTVIFKGFPALTYVTQGGGSAGGSPHDDSE